MTGQDGLEGYEAEFTAARIAELLMTPVQGAFDAPHLREIHRRIFQDLPHHRPGQFREDAPSHVKRRQLEAAAHRYEVYYAPRSQLETDLPSTLMGLAGARTLRGLDREIFCARMASLYGDLDYLHPFQEGNSRTLRLFTTQLAAAAGYRLDWNTSRADAVERDRLYIARDKMVAQRFLASASSEAHLNAYARINGLFGSAESLQSLINGALQSL